MQNNKSEDVIDRSGNVVLEIGDTVEYWTTGGLEDKSKMRGHLVIIDLRPHLAFSVLTINKRGKVEEHCPGNLRFFERAQRKS